MDIKGHTVHQVMIAQGADIAEEYYVSVLLDRANRSFLAMASKEGGMEIEQLAVERPDALAKVPVDALVGIDAAKAEEIVAAAGFDADVAPQVAAVLVKLWDVFVSEDATLVEVNPLVKTGDGRIVALDGKVSLDENANFRHAGAEALAAADVDAADPLEAAAKEKGLNYVKLDGSVGHHRQRRRPGDEHPGRGRRGRGGVRRRQAGQLPRHRRRRQRRGDGERAGDHPVRRRRSRACS